MIGLGLGLDLDREIIAERDREGKSCYITLATVQGQDLTLIEENS
jgi:hypothetical protein